jgi:phosphoribosylformylglycinamidine synthase
VSLSNETDGEAIYPTPIIGMAGLLEKRSFVTTKDFKQAGDRIYLMGSTKVEFGGSELQKMLTGEIFGRPPQLDLEVEKRVQTQVREAIMAGLVQSATDLAEGGLAVAVTECIAEGSLGASLTLGADLASELFSESQSRFLVTVSPENQDKFEELVESTLIGEVKAEPVLEILSSGNPGLAIDLEQLLQAWKGAIPCLLSSGV